MRKGLIILPLACPLLLGGCIAGTLVDIATAPVKATGQVVDWATTSQDEADRNRGREIRRREERLGELYRDFEREERDCLAGDDSACREATEIRREIEELRPQVPLEPE